MAVLVVSLLLLSAVNGFDSSFLFLSLSPRLFHSTPSSSPANVRLHSMYCECARMVVLYRSRFIPSTRCVLNSIDRYGGKCYNMCAGSIIHRNACVRISFSRSVWMSMHICLWISNWILRFQPFPPQCCWFIRPLGWCRFCIHSQMDAFLRWPRFFSHLPRFIFIAIVFRRTNTVSTIDLYMQSNWCIVCNGAWWFYYKSTDVRVQPLSEPTESQHPSMTINIVQTEITSHPHGWNAPDLYYVVFRY